MHVFSTRNLPVAILATRGRGSRRGCYTLEKEHLPALGEITIWYHGRTARLQRSPKRGRSQVQAAIAREREACGRRWQVLEMVMEEAFNKGPERIINK